MRVLSGLLILAASGAIVAWAAWRLLQNSDHPARLVVKWTLTAMALAFLALSAPAFGLAAPGIAAGVGVLLGIIWAPNLGAMIAKPLTAFYDGGEAQVEARPFYSIARARRMRGKYQEAIAEIRKQLDLFSEDYEGWMLLAEIYGDDLKDNPSAQRCVREILSHQGHSPKNIAYALNRSADWHLALAADRESARESLERIIALLPETEAAHAAAQRIAHLTTDQMLAQQRERPRLVITHHEENIGLLGKAADPRPKEESPEEKAARLVEHLNRYPEDSEAREQLAAVYAEHYKRIDLAAEQIDQLIALPGATQKEAARWLNMLVDFHVRVARDKSAAVQTLRRLIEMFPGSGAAAQAESRLLYLDAELRASSSTEVLKLGSHPTNMGLEGGTPGQRPADEP